MTFFKSTFGAQKYLFFVCCQILTLCRLSGRQGFAAHEKTRGEVIVATDKKMNIIRMALDLRK